MNREVRLYADSASVEEVGPLLRDRLVHGVTTNPTILERAGRSNVDMPDLYERWRREGANEIFFQASGTDAASMLASAHGIAALGPLVVVKVPATRVGFGVAGTLVGEGVTVLLTAVYSRAQALAAASLGVRYIAPYLGRLVDAGRDGAAEIIAMQALVEGTGTDVLAASLRNPDALVALAAGGVRYLTAAPSVITAALYDEASERSAAEFEAAVERATRPEEGPAG